MITTLQQAKRVQAKRKARGKTSIAVAVARFLKRSGRSKLALG